MDKINSNTNNNSRKKKNKETKENNNKSDLKQLEDHFIYSVRKAPNKYPKPKFYCRICLYHMDDYDKACKHFVESKHKNNEADLINFQSHYIYFLKKPPGKFPMAMFDCKLCKYHMDDIDKAKRHLNDNKHKVNEKKVFNRNFIRFLPKPCKDHVDNLNEYFEILLTQKFFIDIDEINRRQSYCFELNKIVMEIDNNYRLNICGSLLTSLSLTTFSDVNLYFKRDESTKSSYIEDLTKLSNEINKRLSLKNEIKFDKTKCGLICRDENQVEYHISCSFKSKFQTSTLLRIYMKIDERAYQLAMIFRYFAHKAFLDQVKHGLFPSDVFVILVVFYLQQLSHPILPNLQKLAKLDCVNKDYVTENIIRDRNMSYVNDLNEIRRLWTPPINNMTLADLWIGLLKFYGHKFNEADYIISITNYEPLLKCQRNISNIRLFVEDPSDFKRNLLFNWNTTDVVDYFYDQFHACLIYFSVPQLKNRRPLFTKIAFEKITMQFFNKTILTTLKFDRNDYTTCHNLLMDQMIKEYFLEKEVYNIIKWPVLMFVKKILHVFLNIGLGWSKDDIKQFQYLLELKITPTSYFLMSSQLKFTEITDKLMSILLDSVIEFYNIHNCWNKNEVNAGFIFNFIKKHLNKFLSQSKFIIDRPTELMEFDDDKPDVDNDEEHDDTEGYKHEETLDNINDEDDVKSELSDDNSSDNISNHSTIGELADDTIDISMNQMNNTLNEPSIPSQHVWKLPIAIKDIITEKSGLRKSSNQPNYYHPELLTNLSNTLQFDFDQVPLWRKSLEINCKICNTKTHRRENCPDAIPRHQDLHGILNQVNDSWLIRLDDVLQQKYNNTTTTAESIKKIEGIFQEISTLIKKIYPDCVPQMFGSINNGFMTKASDLDICLEFYDEQTQRKIFSNETIVEFLKQIGQKIRKQTHRKYDVEFILRAKVPIVKFNIAGDNIQGDISINNSLALQNTQMLKLYAEINQHVKLLGGLIKFMSKTCKIGDASQGTLSSYAYIIMLIHFLQKRKVLPVLQQIYEEEQQPKNLIEGWNAWYQTNLSLVAKKWKPSDVAYQLSYLWLDFFYYYAVEFDINREVVTIKQDTKLYKIDKNWQDSYFAIEDPFDLSHNLAGFLSLDKCRYIMQCFAHILKLHSDCSHLQSSLDTNHLLMSVNILNPTKNSTKTCFTCNTMGHVSKDCPNQQNKKIRSNNNEKALAKLKLIQQRLQSPFEPKVATYSKDTDTFLMDFDVNGSYPSLNITAFKEQLDTMKLIPINLDFGDCKIVLPIISSPFILNSMQELVSTNPDLTAIPKIDVNKLHQCLSVESINPQTVSSNNTTSVLSQLSLNHYQPQQPQKQHINPQAIQRNNSIPSNNNIAHANMPTSQLPMYQNFDHQYNYGMEPRQHYPPRQFIQQYPPRVSQGHAPQQQLYTQLPNNINYNPRRMPLHNQPNINNSNNNNRNARYYKP